MLALAKANPEGWQKLQTITLETYLTRRAVDLDKENSEGIYQGMRDIKDHAGTLGELMALGQKYNLIADFDLEAAAVESYCVINNIELSL